MQMKGFLFGFGLGMVFLSVIVMIAYRYENRVNGPVHDGPALARAIYDEAVLTRASELGMVWPDFEEDEGDLLE